MIKTINKTTYSIGNDWEAGTYTLIVTDEHGKRVGEATGKTCLSTEEELDEAIASYSKTTKPKTKK